jgi:hypothetical protein
MTPKQDLSFEQAAGDLAVELATMHGLLYKLITELRTTALTALQGSMVSEAAFELGKSQGRFLATYGDMIGNAAPERN